MIRRIALVVGDTPGHFYPALAVAEAYGRFDGGVDAVFFGPRHSLAADLAARHGCRYQHVSGSALARVGLGGRIAAAGRTVAGIVEARRALGKLNTKLVIGFGGYASGAVLVAARILGLQTAIHEANVRPGLANRLLARLIDRVYLNVAVAAPCFPADRQRVTGWPVRSDVRALGREPRQAPGGRPVRILVCSGSRGGAFLAREVPAMLARVAARGGMALDVQHQAADADPAVILDAYAHAGASARVLPFFDDMAERYRWADLVIARAGAGTLAELALAGLPSLLVPLADASDDHQESNAAAFAASGAAWCTREDAWDAEVLADRLCHLLGDRAAWAAASDAARRMATPNAADAVVDDCEAIMRGRW